MRVAAKKQSQPKIQVQQEQQEQQQQQQHAVEQYLKEVDPTTKTSSRRQTYLRYTDQEQSHKDAHEEPSNSRQHLYKYVPQADLPQYVFF